MGYELGLGAGLLDVIGVANPLTVNQLKAAVARVTGLKLAANGLVDAPLIAGLRKTGMVSAGVVDADVKSAIGNPAIVKTWLTALAALPAAPKKVAGMDPRVLMIGGVAIGGFALLMILRQRRGPRKNPRARRNITAAKRHSLPKRLFAYPEEEKLPIDTTGRTRAAMSRFGQTQFKTRGAKKRAYRRILRRAAHYGMNASGFEARWARLR